MSLDVQELLERGSILGGEPDLAAIERRARRRDVTIRAAAVTMSVGVGLSAWFGWQQVSEVATGTGQTNPIAPAQVSEGPSDGTTSPTQGLAAPQERAATVALAALNAAGLQDLQETYFDYSETTRSENDAWTTHFCSEKQSMCGSGNSDAQLEVVVDGKEMVVVSAHGNLAPHAQELEGYREPAAPPTPGFLYAGFQRGREDAFLLETTHYWTGAIPSNLDASCKFQAIDESGTAVYESKPFAMLGPVVEGARDGVSGFPVPENAITGNYRMECSAFGPNDTVGPHESNEPDSPGTVIATFTSPEPANRTFEVRAWDEADRWCWALNPEELEDQQSTCVPRSMEPITEALAGWGWTEGDPGKTYAYASGQVRQDVARVELRFETGETIVPEIVDAAEDMDIPTRFFVAFVARFESGKIVLLDEGGDVLQAEDFVARDE